MERVAIVTGGAGGIGAAIAAHLASDGATVIVADLDDQAADRVAARVPRAWSVAADLSTPSGCSELVKTVTSRHGTIDILVNNAGLQRLDPIEEFSEASWHLLIAVMLTAPFLLTKAVLPTMYKQEWGRIVNIGSIHSLVGSPNKAAYVAAKHGLLGLTKVTALEAASRSVTANIVCPAFVRTPLVEGQIEDLATTEHLDRRDVEQKILLGPSAIKRLIEPAEVAALVAYLCSDAASAITGSAFPIDAGWTAR